MYVSNQTLYCIPTESVDHVVIQQLAYAAPRLYWKTTIREEVCVPERHGKPEYAGVRMYDVHEFGVRRCQVAHLAHPHIQWERWVESCVEK